MRNLERLVTVTGFIRALIAGTILLAMIDGASAQDNARAGSDMPVTNPIRNTIHPIITDPDHKSERCQKYHRCHVKVRFVGPPVPAPTYPTKPAPASTAPGSTAPVEKRSGY